MTSLYDYDAWPNFTKEDLVCRYTGLENPNVEEFHDFMCGIQDLRTWANVPFIVSSGYRSPIHPAEVKKTVPGEHTRAAIDFRVPTAQCHRILAEAYRRGYTGIGVKLCGDRKGRFIHLDQRTTPARSWSY